MFLHASCGRKEYWKLGLCQSKEQSTFILTFWEYKICHVNTTIEGNQDTVSILGRCLYLECSGSWFEWTEGNSLIIYIESKKRSPLKWTGTIGRWWQCLHHVPLHCPGLGCVPVSISGWMIVELRLLATFGITFPLYRQNMTNTSDYLIIEVTFFFFF